MYQGTLLNLLDSANFHPMVTVSWLYSAKKNTFTPLEHIKNPIS